MQKCTKTTTDIQSRIAQLAVLC